MGCGSSSTNKEMNFRTLFASCGYEVNKWKSEAVRRVHEVFLKSKGHVCSEWGVPKIWQDHIFSKCFVCGYDGRMIGMLLNSDFMIKDYNKGKEIFNNYYLEAKSFMKNNFLIIYNCLPMSSDCYLEICSACLEWAGWNGEQFYKREYIASEYANNSILTTNNNFNKDEYIPLRIK